MRSTDRQKDRSYNPSKIKKRARGISEWKFPTDFMFGHLLMTARNLNDAGVPLMVWSVLLFFKLLPPTMFL